MSPRRPVPPAIPSKCLDRKPYSLQQRRKTMSSSKVRPSANNAETPDPAEKPVALADEQLDRVAAGAVSVTPADLQQAASAAADIAAAVKPAKIAVPITMGIILPPYLDA
jgi:hypothetical protein